MVDGMLDGGDGTDDTLVVGDLFVLVEWDVEVDLCTRWLAWQLTYVLCVQFHVAAKSWLSSSVAPAFCGLAGHWEFSQQPGQMQATNNNT